MLVFTVTGEPMGKGRPRFVRATGRVYTPKKTESYECRVAAYGQAAMGDAKPLNGGLSMMICATYLIPESWSKKKKSEAMWKTSKPDADNIAKICKDALNKIAYHDDAQICELFVQKKYGPIAGLTVTVAHIDSEARAFAWLGIDPREATE